MVVCECEGARCVVIDECGKTGGRAGQMNGGEASLLASAKGDSLWLLTNAGKRAGGKEQRRRGMIVGECDGARCVAIDECGNVCACNGVRVARGCLRSVKMGGRSGGEE